MPRLSTRIALLAVAGILSVASPALAAPGNTNGYNKNSGSGSAELDCSLLVNIHNPLCVDQLKGQNKGSGANNRVTNGTTTTNNSNGNNGSNGSNGGSGQTDKGPKPGTFNFNKHDRDQFHQRFHGFNFGNFSFFLAPSFSITIGTNVPSLYHHHLKPVPASIYRYYPWFRGYLYFVDRQGDFVIVSPRTYHIVAVL